ncbi:hypothetical protein BV25DRAFT_1385571 [Artomyces pyxidatus]|uniref:Uncharacterized protein n=1 Tax=Artomyces pyxidatus TaxID=48021 RepID=A0ACB8TDI4_9AGAM|nr:hypothetical protein BV25DRAFT_1385571 [Artomyces pyxidatus]
MSTRRRIGISTATSEAARRQLMQPVPCWEKVWVVPEKAAPGSTMKIFKWVKTEKTQQFSDDEGDVDEPLAPLPDEPEVVEGDDEMDQDDATQSVPPEPVSRADSELIAPTEELPSKAPSPKPHPLSISFQPLDDETPDDVLSASLKVPDDLPDMGSGLDVRDALNPEGLVDLDMSQLGPDGTAFESAQDLTQMDQTDALLGGEMMDDSIGDPFAMPES